MGNKIKKHIILLLSMLMIFNVMACGKNNNKADISGDGTTLDDTQPYFNTVFHVIAKGEKGYYFISKAETNKKYTSDNFLFFMDGTTKECIKLCGKAECNHKNEECNAYLGKDYLKNIYFYNNKLYLIKYENGKAVLEEILPDGTDRKKIGEIGTSTGKEQVAQKLAFSGDNVYILDGNENESSENDIQTVRVYKMSLLDGKKEVAYEYKGFLATIKSLRSYGGNIYFKLDCMVEKNTDNNSSGNGRRQFKMSGDGVVKIDGKTGETSKVLEGVISDYAIDIDSNNIYYYEYSKGLYCMDAGTGKSELIYKADDSTASCVMSYDGNNIYLDNTDWVSWGHVYGGTPKYDKKCFVLDKQGNKTGDVDISDLNLIYYGDSEYLFGEKYGEREASMVYIEKSKLPNTEWKYVVEE